MDREREGIQDMQVEPHHTDLTHTTIKVSATAGSPAPSRLPLRLPSAPPLRPDDLPYSPRLPSSPGRTIPLCALCAVRIPADPFRLTRQESWLFSKGEQRVKCEHRA